MANILIDFIAALAEMALIRHIVPAALDVQQGNWRRELFIGRQLSGKTLGIIGYGRLGKHLARYGKAFGMRVLCSDIKSDLQVEDGIERVDLDIRPYDDVINGRPFRAAYLQKMYITQKVDRFADRYAAMEHPEE